MREKILNSKTDDKKNNEIKKKLHDENMENEVKVSHHRTQEFECNKKKNFFFSISFIEIKVSNPQYVNELKKKKQDSASRNPEENSRAKKIRA